MNLNLDISVRRTGVPISAWCLAGSVLLVHCAVEAMPQTPPANRNVPSQRVLQRVWSQASSRFLVVDESKEK